MLRVHLHSLQGQVFLEQRVPCIQGQPICNYRNVWLNMVVAFLGVSAVIALATDVVVVFLVIFARCWCVVATVAHVILFGN